MQTPLLAALMLALAASPSLAQNAGPNPLDVIPEQNPYAAPYGAPITLERAQAVINAGAAECKKRGWLMNLTVVDSGGNLVAFARMDGAQLGSVDVSQHKAKAAVTFRRETKVWENGVQGGNVYQLTLDGMIASRGGIPLVEGGKIIGGVGASGGAGSQDEVCAKAAAAVINR
jgi:uncharacterized protein GlcG (DUF336 family)